MSIENVKAFYQRVANDSAFSERLKNSKSKNECSQIAKEAGYDFTREEYEEFTAQLLELKTIDSEFRELDREELAVIFGGMIGTKYMSQLPPYGHSPELYNSSV
jgi:predicted ribosomally synthesized peptide with nif11-like leader